MSNLRLTIGAGALLAAAALGGSSINSAPRETTNEPRASSQSVDVNKPATKAPADSQQQKRQQLAAIAGNSRYRRGSLNPHQPMRRGLYTYHCGARGINRALFG